MPVEPDPKEKDWDLYPSQVDNKPASIFVDLAAMDDAPVAGLDQMVFLKVFMRSPRTDGLSSDEEYQTLALIEDAAALAAETAGMRYVGRQTTDGFRDFVFYSASDEVEEILVEVMDDFPGYKFETGVRPDSEWAVYIDYLYPDERTHQGMMNRRLYEQLAQQGDDNDTPREIDHFASFATAYQRSIFVEECLSKGFMVRALADPSKDNKLYEAQVFRMDAPDGDTFDEVTMILLELAAESGGDYDGWETEVVTRPTPDNFLGKFFGKKP